LTVSLESVKKAEITSQKLTVIGRRLDSIDVHLLRQLIQGRTLLTLDPNFRKSFRLIAKTLSIDVDTVRGRLRRLQTIGFIRNWNVLLNPSVFGLRESLVWFDVPAALQKHDVVESLKLVPGVFVIANFYGPLTIVFFRHEDSGQSPQREINLIRKLSGAAELKLAHVPWPNVSMKMTENDWTIIRAMQRDPRKSYVTISKQTGISTRTVQRRLRRMLKEAVIYNLPALNYQALDGTLIGGLIIGHSQERGQGLIREVHAALDQYLWYSFPMLPPETERVCYTMISLALPNVAKAREILTWVREQEGVRDARIEFNDEQITIVENLSDIQASRLSRR
jgi:DNA-binding Lrp family transcriptional regulator